MEYRICSTFGCTEKHLAKGFCHKHYHAAKRAEMPCKRLSLVDRLKKFSNFNPNTGCIEWTGGKSGGGYGQLEVNGKSAKAHRIAWELKNGKIPEGMIVCHKCDNPACLNPAHLFLGTNVVNSLDMVSKGRQARLKGELNSQAKITEEQVKKILGDQRLQREIAVDHGISIQNVNAIKRGRAWAHLPRF